MKIKKGDTVKVLIGKENGKEGKVERVYSTARKVLLENMNLFKKAIKKTEQTPNGGIVEVPRPMNISNVMLVCPNCKKPTRVGYKVQAGKKTRFCKQCNKNIN
jgi:large subunit ribosomal protein L24